jgi:hypothetical protein
MNRVGFTIGQYRWATTGGARHQSGIGAGQPAVGVANTLEINEPTETATAVPPTSPRS